MKNLLAVMAFVFALASPLSAQSTPSKPVPIHVETGLVQGIVEQGLTVYRGIPFAAPPIGERRWRPPAPADNWKGVRKAFDFAPGCMQATLWSSVVGRPDLPFSEDCLYLNVWSPARSPKERLPVMVWIYGGGFVSGFTSLPLYSGENLARKGVVVVSIAYRVGPFGFLAHPETRLLNRVGTVPATTVYSIRSRAWVGSSAISLHSVGTRAG